MKYEHVVEERDYKYGPGEKCKTKEELKDYLRLERGKMLTQISLAGFVKAVKITEEEHDDSINLKVVISYPVDLLPD